MSKISMKKFLETAKKTNGRCAYCGVELDEDNCTIDHIIPISKNGNNEVSNLFLCCKSCNSTKRDRTLNYFRYLMTCKIRNIPKFDVEQILYLKKINLYETIFPSLEKFYFEKLEDVF